ncbi:hypothetical protein IWX91DRAFT_337315 [Phyllosticta citricarpa]
MCRFPVMFPTLFFRCLLCTMSLFYPTSSSISPRTIPLHATILNTYTVAKPWETVAQVSRLKLSDTLSIYPPKLKARA